jgi:membrane-bound serine protease (ClpP class)
MAAACATGQTPSRPDARDPSEAADGYAAVVVPISGAIGVVTVAMVSRAYREARAHGMTRVVLDIDTPGGAEVSMREVENILASIKREGIRTVAYVRRHALSAGAYIALACNELFMAPAATIGAITPVLVGPGGTLEIPQDDARRKAYAAMRADVRALVEQRGGVRKDAVQIAEAMVDPGLRVFEITYEDNNGLRTTEVMLEDAVRDLEARQRPVLKKREFGSRPLVLVANEAEQFGFARGTFESLEDLLRDELVVAPEHTLFLSETWSESAVAWLDAMKPILFVLGFLLLAVEMKTPGIAVPGVLGVLMLGLALFGSYLVGLAEVTEILLFFLGLAALAAEIFILPGGIVFGAIGFTCLVAALVLSQQTFVLPSSSAQSDIMLDNLLNLFYMVVGVVVAFAAYARLLPHIPVLNRVLLAPPPRGALTGTIGAAPPPEAGGGLVGQVGVATTDLRPAGIVELGDRRYDAVSKGSFIAAGTAVRVLQMAYYRLVVEDAGAAGTASPGAGERGQVSLGVIFLLVVVGLGLVVAEVFFVSFGVISSLAALCLLSAVFLAFSHHGNAFGFAFLAAAAVGVPAVLFLSLRWLPRTRIGKELLLSGPDPDQVKGAAVATDYARLLHQGGVTLSPLRPSGIARIQGTRVDVVTRGEMLEAQVPVKVIEVRGNRVVVTLDRERIVQS